MSKMVSSLTLPALALAFAACGGSEPHPRDRADAPPPAAGPALADTGKAAAPAAAPAPATPPAGEPTAAADGRAVYARTCQTCHQANGAGLPGAFPPLTASEYVNGDKARLIRIVLHGLTGPITVNGQNYNGLMTPWKMLSDAEIAAVLTYERSNFQNNASAVTAAEVAAQRSATASRTTPYTIAELR